ncbi:MAG: hypothetical protein NTU79_02585 [Planctomycetota bacterium]|nr:hypothetical protein [Planctomycetota bacterium]
MQNQNWVAFISESIRGHSHAAESKAHAERFGIFVGLWAPTFFALSTKLEQYSGIEKP